MLRLGISGNFYHIIKSMYSISNFAVKLPIGILPPFLSNTGLKQGCNLSPTLANLFQNDLHDIFDDSCSPVNLGNICFNSLSWADDLVLISTTPQGLQRCLDKLKDYCNTWGLTVNKAKTKCMTFSSGNVRSKNCMFFDNKPLSQVNSFEYLGIILQSNGKFKQAIAARMAKATRALFMYKQALKTTGNVNTRLTMSIFDKQIIPVLTYGCPIWGLPSTTNYLTITGTNDTRHARQLINTICGRSIATTWIRNTSSRGSPSELKVLMNLDNFEDKEIILLSRHKLPTHIAIHDNFLDCDTYTYEKLHTQFCKFVLNIPRQAGNHASRGELGRFPLCNKIWSLAAKYWLRLEYGTENIFLNNAFACAKAENHTWVQQIHSILTKFGFGHIWNNPLLTTPRILGKTFQMRLNDIYTQTWSTTQSQSSRFSLQASLQQSYQMSPYLDNVETIEPRNILTRLRIDMNYLNESLGRQQRAPNRFCPNCQSTIETVNHFIMDCPLYDSQRSQLYESILPIDHHFHYLNIEEKFKYIINVEYAPSSNAISKFISAIYHNRQQLSSL